MTPEFENTFTSLREILRRNRGTLRVKEDSSECYSLEADAGPAAIRAWGGKLKKPVLPVAWVEIGKAYVSFHVMGMYGNDKLRNVMSKELKARMQGKTCFNFKHADEKLFAELEQVTVQAMAGFKKAGFVA